MPAGTKLAFDHGADGSNASGYAINRGNAIGTQTALFPAAPQSPANGSPAADQSGRSALFAAIKARRNNYN